MLPLIVFAILFGFCVSACGGEESPMGKLLANLNDIIMKFVGMIMLVAPIGLGAYFANLVVSSGPRSSATTAAPCWCTTPVPPSTWGDLLPPLRLPGRRPCGCGSACSKTFSPPPSPPLPPSPRRPPSP